MNSLTVHRVIIGALVIVAGFFAWKASDMKLDGNPSGLDITMKGAIGVYQQGDFDRLSCPRSNDPCQVQVELHYLVTPAPSCPPSPSPHPGVAISGCAPLPAPEATRTLPGCNTGANEVCLSVNTSNTGNVAQGSPLTVAIQDDDGWRYYPTNGQFIFVVNSGHMALKAKKK
jgi:hypothetical protein